jgi:CDP-diacylglycerol---glycerol-3-phosphate 3-phosphatidyltransferase
MGREHCWLAERITIMYSDPSGHIATQRALSRLKRLWLVFSVLSFTALGGLFAFFAILWEPRYAIGWGIKATLGLFYLSWVLFHNLNKNHRPEEFHLLSTLGPGNTLTLMRGVLLAFLAGFLFLPQPGNSLAWAPTFLFTLAIAADFFDGYLARVTNHVTRLGEALDMRLDGLGILVASLLAIHYGQLPLWYLFVPLARYLFQGGLFIRSKLGQKLFELPESIRRRAFAGLQMGFISVMLWPVFTPPGTFLAALFFALPFLSGFILDWLYVSGVIHKKSAPRYADSRWLVAKATPLAIRLILLSGMILFSGERYLHYFNRSSSYITLDIPPILSFWIVSFGVETIIMLLLILGMAGRLASIAGLLLLGLDQIFGSLQPVQYLLIVVYISLIYLGTGPFSLWKPEDGLIFRKVGEAKGVSIEARSSNPYGD